MPSQPGQTDPLNVASIIYEDHAILAIRVERLLEARALVLTPMPHTTHLVSNIEAERTGDNEFTACAAFMSIEHQADRQKIYSGAPHLPTGAHRKLVQNCAGSESIC